MNYKYVTSLLYLHYDPFALLILFLAGHAVTIEFIPEFKKGYILNLKWTQFITDTGASNWKDMMKNTLQEEVASDANQLARHTTFSAICHRTESHASPSCSFCTLTIKELELDNF